MGLDIGGGSGSSAPALEPTALKTASYDAQAGEEVLLDPANAGDSGTFTVNTSTNILTFTGMTPTDGMVVTLSSDDTLPAELQAGASYFLRDVSGQTSKVSYTRGGLAIDITDTGAGTHTATIVAHVLNFPAADGTPGSRFAITVVSHGAVGFYVSPNGAAIQGSTTDTHASRTLASMLPATNGIGDTALYWNGASLQPLYETRLRGPGLRIEFVLVDETYGWHFVPFGSNLDVALIQSDTVDARNSPTTTLSPGLPLGIVNATGKLKTYDNDAIDGTEIPLAVLAQQVVLGGTPSDKWALVHRAGVMLAGYLPVDLVDQQLIDRLAETGIIASSGQWGGTNFYYHRPRHTWRRSSNLSLNANTHHNALFVCTAAVQFTLPTIAAGLRFEFFQTSDNNMVITGGASSIIGFNTASASTITFSTSGEKIGASCVIEAIFTATNTLKWKSTITCRNTAVYS